MDPRTESPMEARVESAIDDLSTLTRGRKGDRGGGDSGGTSSMSLSAGVAVPRAALPLPTVLPSLDAPEPSSIGLSERNVGSGCGGLHRFRPGE